MFVTEELAEGARFDIVHVNNDLTCDDNRFEFTDPDVPPASDHEPILARFSFDDDGDDDDDDEED